MEIVDTAYEAIKVAKVDGGEVFMLHGDYFMKMKFTVYSSDGVIDGTQYNVVNLSTGDPDYIDGDNLVYIKKAKVVIE